ncbi:MAG: hypothetical protein AB7N24_14460 [Dehalococcoidia bacterium]
MAGVILVGSLVIGPALQNLTDSSASGLQQAELGNSRWTVAIAGLVNLAFISLAATLAIFKPWGRIRRDNRNGY